MALSERECSTCRAFQLVKRQLSESEERAQELRTKLKETRLELANTTRQLDVSKRMLSKVAADKSQLEANAEQDKAATRRLEHRLAAATAGEGLQAKLNKYKTQLVELRELHADTEARLIMAEEAKENAAREIHVLKSALGLRSALPDGALESHGKLLHALAQSEEESSALALALADKEQALSEGAGALRAAQGEVERLLAVRLELMQRVEAGRGEVGEALELAEVYRREVAAAQKEAAQLQEQLEQTLGAHKRTESLLRATEASLAAQQDKNKQLVDKIASLEKSSRLSAEALQSEVSHALERADVRLQEAKVEAATRQAALSEQLASTQQALEAAQAALAAASRRHEDDMAERDAALARVRAERGAAECEAAEARRELGSMRSQLSAEDEECRRLRAELSATRSEALEASEALAHERNEAMALRSRVEAVDARLRQSLSASSQREDSLKAEVSQLRSQLSSATLSSSQLQEELRAVREQALDAAGQYAHVDTQVEELQATIHALTQSKAKLQSGLLEQLSSFREKLSLVEEENRKLRLALGMAGSRPAAGQLQSPNRPSGYSSTDRALEHAVTAASAAAAAVRVSATRSPNTKAPALFRTSLGTPSSLLGRARDHSRALGCEDSEDDEDDLRAGAGGRDRRGQQGVGAVGAEGRTRGNITGHMRGHLQSALKR